jgi:hypothetical protein
VRDHVPLLEAKDYACPFIGCEGGGDVDVEEVPNALTCTFDVLE